MVTVIEDADAPRDWSAHGLTLATRWAQPPTRDEVRDAVRTVDADGVLVSGSAAALNAVVDGLRRRGALDTPVGFLPVVPAKGRLTPAQTATHELVARLGLPTELDAVLAAEPVELMLARNDMGAVLLGEAHLEHPKLDKYGAQAYHDDQLVANGEIRGISVIPAYRDGMTLQATVTPASGRQRTTTTYGRALQIACDPAPMTVDGRDFGVIESRTWYVDDREHWLLRGARPHDLPAPSERQIGFWKLLFGR